MELLIELSKIAVAIFLSTLLIVNIINNDWVLSKYALWEARRFSRRINNNPRREAMKFCEFILKDKGHLYLNSLDRGEIFDDLIVKGVTRESAIEFVDTINRVDSALSRFIGY